MTWFNSAKIKKGLEKLAAHDKDEIIEVVSEVKMATRHFLQVIGEEIRRCKAAAAAAVPAPCVCNQELSFFYYQGIYDYDSIQIPHAKVYPRLWVSSDWPVCLLVCLFLIV